MTRIYTTRFKLGMFDPQEQVPYSIPESVINSRRTGSWPTKRRSSRSCC